MVYVVNISRGRKHESVYSRHVYHFIILSSYPHPISVLYLYLFVSILASDKGLVNYFSNVWGGSTSTDSETGRGRSCLKGCGVGTNAILQTLNL